MERYYLRIPRKYLRWDLNTITSSLAFYPDWIPLFVNIEITSFSKIIFFVYSGKMIDEIDWNWKKFCKNFNKTFNQLQSNQVFFYIKWRLIVFIALECHSSLEIETGPELDYEIEENAWASVFKSIKLFSSYELVFSFFISHFWKWCAIWHFFRGSAHLSYCIIGKTKISDELWFIIYHEMWFPLLRIIIHTSCHRFWLTQPTLGYPFLEFGIQIDGWDLLNRRKNNDSY